MNPANHKMPRRTTISKAWYLASNTFPKARSESTRQDINESMVKCKTRTSLKQYIPLKSIKRGIKLWMAGLRC